MTAPCKSLNMDDHVHLHQVCSYETFRDFKDDATVHATCLECGVTGRAVVPTGDMTPIWPTHIVQALKNAEHISNCNTMLVISGGIGTWEDGIQDKIK